MISSEQEVLSEQLSTLTGILIYLRSFFVVFKARFGILAQASTLDSAVRCVLSVVNTSGPPTQKRLHVQHHSKHA